MENSKNKATDRTTVIQARSLYWQGWRVVHIAEHLNISQNTVAWWKSRYKWDEKSPVDRATDVLEVRYMQLINKECKTAGDFKEIDLLGRQLERFARIGKYNETGKESDLNPNILNRNAAPKRKPRQNLIEEAYQKKIQDAFQDVMFDYQRKWYECLPNFRIRNILKSRQIGATYYFALEAFVDAAVNGKNQIFISASKSQAHVFRQYIIKFCRDVCGVELKGDPIMLDNGAGLYFLGTNSRTAQSYHGNLYMDEYFWIPDFQDIQKVASGMATHKHWRQTYFSTPSTINHPAFPFWDGTHYNKGRSRTDHILLDVSHKTLVDGRLCEDGQWRQIVNIEDALASGCDLFDIEQLKREKSPEDFANLFMCQFMDDSNSVFPLAELQACMVDSWAEWSDFKPYTTRPLGNSPVWIGYDPAYSGDSAGIAVVAPPAVTKGKFRVLEKHQFKGMDFAAQAQFIHQLTQKYNTTHIGIDASGMGVGVLQLVKEFFPAVTAYTYSPEIKNRLVLKAKDVIRNRRLEFDAGWSDVAQAFMTIRRTMTASGKHSTFEAGRSNTVGHADIAWAIMHALAHEPLQGPTTQHKSILEISS